MLQRICLASRTVGAVISICRRDTCDVCGTANTAVVNEWTIIECNSVTSGDVMKLDHATQRTNLCEVQLVGNQGDINFLFDISTQLPCSPFSPRCLWNFSRRLREWWGVRKPGCEQLHVQRDRLATTVHGVPQC